MDLENSTDMDSSDDSDLQRANGGFLGLRWQDYAEKKDTTPESREELLKTWMQTKVKDPLDIGDAVSYYSTYFTRFDMQKFLAEGILSYVN